MKYISLFAGIGGFDLALNRLGHECVWANEWDKYAAQIYDKNFCGGRLLPRQGEVLSGGVANITGGQAGLESIDTRDLRTVPTSEIPDHDLLVGGFPCQAFSIAGKRRGFEDTRGTLFWDIARILKDKHPSYFILENVKGLLSHNGGSTFKTIISTLAELGYDLEWQVLNSKNFGVPQNRERVFIVGHTRGQPRPEVFPIGGGGEKNNETRISKTIRSGYYKQGFGSQMIDSIAHTVRNGGRASGIDKKQNWDSYEVGGRIRRLTPTECERLQGFPDGWTEGISDTQRYKCLGNAVTVNVVYEVAKRL